MKTAVTVSLSDKSIEPLGKTLGHVRIFSEIVNPQSEVLVVSKHGVSNYGQRNVSYEDLSQETCVCLKSELGSVRINDIGQNPRLLPYHYSCHCRP